MSIHKIHLRKLLQLFYAEKSLRASKLREDIRTGRAKAAGTARGGGDFHTAFWADDKKHVLEEGDLAELSRARVLAAKGKERLYPLLAQGFLQWWNNRRRWRNEPLVLLPTPSNAYVAFKELGATVKVENLMGLESGLEFHRIMHPYFAEEPALSPEAARLGLWAMQAALQRYDLADMRILDVLRGRSVGTIDVRLLGDERETFVRRYAALIEEWEVLSREYD